MDESSGAAGEAAEVAGPIRGQPDEGLLGLVMIVRDEASRIGPALAHYSSIVDDVTILDTGSMDGTQDLVRRAFERGLRGRLYEEPFVDFATSRNRALDLHGRRTTFTLTANVDRLEGGTALRAFLAERVTGHDHEGAYRVRLQPGCYYQTVVLRAASGWRYVGRTHEVAIGAGLGPIVPGVSLVVDRAARTPEAWRRRWLRDVELLQRDLAERPDDARTVFYLAQTHECLGDLPTAIALYARRTQMVGFWEETHEAALRRGRLLDRQGSEEAASAYLEAHVLDSRRAEPLHALALRYYRERGYALAYLYARRAAELPLPRTDLFLDEEVYTWKSSDLVAASAIHLGGDIDPTAWSVGLAHARRACEARPGDARLTATLATLADERRDETAYETSLRRARVLDRQGCATETRAAYLEAHTLDPRRAEPLFDLALHWLRAGRIALAYLYARRAAELPAPTGAPSVDEDVYAWGARDLVAASAFYLRDADPIAFGVGFACAQLAHQARPDDPRLAANLAHYQDVISRLQGPAAG